MSPNGSQPALTKPDTSVREIAEAVGRKAGAEIVRLEREFQARSDAIFADCRARLAEVELAAERAISGVKERAAELRNGLDGRDGAQGEPGIRGERGDAGEPGAAGAQGQRGEQGPQGDPGVQGEPGIDGRHGIDGKNGLDGPPGPPGADGRDGVPGRDGQPGAAGRDGAAGPAGEHGERGDAGEIGPPGAVGEAGPHGLQGERGETGAQGRDGQGFDVRGTYEPSTEYFAGDVVACNGGSFVALNDDPGECPGPFWQLWARQGKPGAKGDRGDRGERGERGLPGATVRLVGGEVDVERMQLRLVQDNGETVEVDLYPMAEVIRATM